MVEPKRTAEPRSGSTGASPNFRRGLLTIYMLYSTYKHT
jgi:hypothetical protein